MWDDLSIVKMKKGFTLVEVTVALALFGVAVVVLTQSFLGGMFSLESFKFDSTDDEALMFVYDQVLVLGKQDIEHGGAITTANNGVAKWSGSVQSTSVLELYKVILRVSFEEKKSLALSKTKSKSQPKTYTEEFYLYRPEWADAGERDAFLTKHKEKERSKP